MSVGKVRVRVWKRPGVGAYTPPKVLYRGSTAQNQYVQPAYANARPGRKHKTLTSQQLSTMVSQQGGPHGADIQAAQQRQAQFGTPDQLNAALASGMQVGPYGTYDPTNPYDPNNPQGFANPNSPNYQADQSDYGASYGGQQYGGMDAQGNPYQGDQGDDDDGYDDYGYDAYDSYDPNAQASADQNAYADEYAQMYGGYMAGDDWSHCACIDVPTHVGAVRVTGVGFDFGSALGAALGIANSLASNPVLAAVMPPGTAAALWAVSNIAGAQKQGGDAAAKDAAAKFSGPGGARLQKALSDSTKPKPDNGKGAATATFAWAPA